MMMRHELGRIGGEGTGCMSRPSSVAVPLDGPTTSKLADIALETGELIQDAATRLLMDAIKAEWGGRQAEAETWAWLGVEEARLGLGAERAVAWD